MISTTVLESGKSKSKVVADSVSGESPASSLQMAISPLHNHAAKSRDRDLKRALIPFTGALIS